jgi:hypothetical protein
MNDSAPRDPTRDTTKQSFNAKVDAMKDSRTTISRLAA